MQIPITRSIWTAGHESARYPTLEGLRTCDVAIIGGGITGLTAALRLARAGKSVFLLEARALGGGATHGSTGHLTEAIDAGYVAIEHKFGPEGARLVAASSRAAMDHIADNVAAYDIDCDLETVPGYLFTDREDDLGRLADERSAATRAGVRVERHVTVPVPFAIAGGIQFVDQRQLHVERYLDGLARAATDTGARLFEHSRVLAVEDGEQCIVHLEDGATVRAKSVFFATHAPLNRMLLQTKLAHYRSYAAAFPVTQAPKALLWDMADPYHYIRSALIDGKVYTVIGGEDHKTGAQTHTLRPLENLVAYAHDRFGLSKPAYQWSGQVIESVDGLPLIGRNSLSENLYVATGYAGNGLTFGTVAALLVTDLVLGLGHACTELYDPRRVKPVAAAGKYLSENVDFPAHLFGDRLAPAARSVSEIQRDEGKIVRVKGERLAVYRDSGGGLHAVSAVCTHLGCLVKYNEVERTWDCPCHGSRFDVEGAVVNGPAIHCLAHREIEQTPANREETNREEAYRQDVLPVR